MDNTANPPKDINEYYQWLRQRHRVSMNRRTRTYYGTVAASLRRSFEESSFWTALLAGLRNYDEEYLMQTSYRLWMEANRQPALMEKPFNSFALKTFRRNVSDNANWPAPPPGGWLLPENWFSRIPDIVRTSLVVKYMDGVEFLCQKLEELCNSEGLRSELSFEARDEGYYAAHFLVRLSVQIPQMDFDTQSIDAWFEIQVTTQLQEVIRRMLHAYYDERRQLSTAGAQRNWQWDYQSEEFAANYLGHILHYVEGMIMDVRERTRTRDSASKGEAR